MLSLFHPNDSIRLVFSGLYESTLAQGILLSANIAQAQTHHLYHLARFFFDLQSYGYLVVDDHLDAKSCKTIAIFLDVPCDDLASKELIALSDESILLLAEHPYYQPKSWKDFASCVDTVIHSYQLPASLSCNRALNSITSFAYRDLPDCTGIHEEEVIYSANPSIFNGSSYLASIFCSDFVSPSSSLYAFRRHLINASVMALGSNFLHCGKGWLEPRTLKGFIRGLKKQYVARRNRFPAISLDSYHGSPPTKSLLSICHSTYSIENFLEPRGYTTEKPLEALSFGSIPVYVGCNDGNWLSRFIPIYSASTFQVLSSVSSYANQSLHESRQHAIKLRAEINSFLNSTERTSLALLFSLLNES